MTKAISEELNIKMHMYLWKVLDLMVIKRKGKMYYFQVIGVVNINNKMS